MFKPLIFDQNNLSVKNTVIVRAGSDREINSDPDKNQSLKKGVRCKDLYTRTGKSFLNNFSVLEESYVPFTCLDWRGGMWNPGPPEPVSSQSETAPRGTKHLSKPNPLGIKEKF